MNRIVNRFGGFPLVCVGMLLLFSRSGASNTPQDDISSKLAGSWAGEGKAFGRPSRPEMKWELTLNGKFIKLNYKNQMKSSKGETQIFEGHGYYKSLGGGKYQGTWFDSQGAQHPIKATFEDNALTANWGTPETEEGRTVYRLTATDEIEVVDSVRKKDGTWQEFSRAKLKRM